MTEYIQIEVHNSQDLGDIFFQSGIQPRLYLRGILHEPSYEYDEEGTEDGNGDFVFNFKRWEKKYTIETHQQENLVDFLALLPMFDEVYITTKNQEFSRVKDVEVDVSWDDTVNCFANVKIYFNTETIVKLNCDQNIAIECFDPVYTCGGINQLSHNNYTQPVVEGISNGTYWFFYASHTDDRWWYGIGTGVYKLVSGEWVEQDVEDFAIIDITGLTPTEVFKSGTNFFKYLSRVIEVTDNGGQNATVRGHSYQQAFAQVQYSDDDVNWNDFGDPVMSSELEWPGVSADLPGADTYYFRIKIYKHNCDEIISDSESQVIA